MRSSISIDLDHETMSPTTVDQAISKVKSTQAAGVSKDDEQKLVESKSNVAGTITRSASIYCLMLILNALRIG